MSSPPRKSDPYGGGVLSTPEYDVQARAKEEKAAKKKSTDFQSINRELGGDERPRFQKRTITDNLIDVFTPLMIFVMVLSVIWYLLDVRFIFTEAEHVSMRFVAFLIIMGIVALNRLVARGGSDESIIYTLGLVLATGLYTLSTAPVAGGLLTGPWGSTFVNIMIVTFVWWSTNRLMHECCVDENMTAGDVGILAGTVRRFQKALKPDENQRRKPIFVSMRPKGHLLEQTELEAVDPLDWVDPDKVKKKKIAYEAPSKRMGKRHPGVSIFYFAALTMVVFALGLPVLLQGGELYVLRGHMYVGAYTTAALTLLMLTSLGGLRQYFRSRDVFFPKMIGVFWLGLGSVMVVMVLLGALSLPMPSMPPMIHIENHETDFWTRGSTFELQGGMATNMAQAVEASGILDRIGNGVLLLFGVFLLFSMLRLVGSIAAWVGRNREWYPNFVVEFFNGLDTFLQRVVRIPSLPKPKRLLRIHKGVAQSTAFSSQMRGEGTTDREQVSSYVAHAYDALCALAYDMGVAKQDDQTPYEFIDSFPKELKGMKKEARILTEMYVRAAYSELEMDKKALDRLRQFWFTYDKIRARYVR